MAGSVVAAAVELRAMLAEVDPALLSASDCAELAEVLAATEKACAAARLMAAARAVEAGAYRERGFSDGAAWLARHSGSTGAAARQALAVAGRLEGCPATREALVSGQISLSQAGEIATAESETPGAEAVLLPVACEGDLSRLRERAREHLQAHTPVEDLHRQQQQARFFRHWRDQVGMVCFAGALPPETGLPLVRRVELGALRARRAAGEKRESFDAHAADAFAGLLSGGGAPRRKDRVELVIVCDLAAWRRGHAHPGEVCQIIDGGPIPVHLAKTLGKDAFLQAVLHTGVNIHTVARFGRYQPAELRAALDLGPVPAFTGRECADCGRRYGLHYDHVDPVANQGQTSFANIAARCYPCHQVKTDQDRKAGLLGPHPPRPPPNTS